VRFRREIRFRYEASRGARWSALALIPAPPARSTVEKSVLERFGESTPVSETPPRTAIRLACPGLPLAVYREIAAHLRQVTEVAVELQPQTSEQFDYQASQLGGLALSYPAHLAAAERDRLAAILDYYAQRYGAWQHLPEVPAEQPTA